MYIDYMNLKLIHVFFFYVSVLSVTFLISQISLIEQVESLMGLYEFEQVESCTSKFMNKHTSPVYHLLLFLFFP
jgi:hypothetical protein